MCQWDTGVAHEATGDPKRNIICAVSHGVDQLHAVGNWSMDLDNNQYPAVETQSPAMRPSFRAVNDTSPIMIHALRAQCCTYFAR